MDNKILEEARDTMLTACEKLGCAGIISSWTRRDGTVVTDWGSRRPSGLRKTSE